MERDKNEIWIYVKKKLMKFLNKRNQTKTKTIYNWDKCKL